MISAELVNTGLTLRQVADKLGLTCGRVSQLVRSRRIKPAARIGRMLLFSRESVEGLVSLREATTQRDMSMIEAAHTFGMAPSEFREVVQRHDITHELRQGIYKFSETELRSAAQQLKIPFRIEPSDPDSRTWYRQQSRMVAYRARRTGRLKPKPCVQCKSTNEVHGHHDDYTKPLVVVWLCKACHERLHECCGPPKSLMPKQPKPKLPRKETLKGLTFAEKRERLATIVSRALAGESVKSLADEFDLCVPYVRAKVLEHK